MNKIKENIVSFFACGMHGAKKSAAKYSNLSDTNTYQGEDE